MAVTSEVLASSDIFNKVPREDLDKVVAFAREESFKEGEILFTEGGAPRDMYIIVEGKVGMEMSLSPTPGVGQQTAVENIGKGQTCGYSSVRGLPYMMTARAAERISVIAIEGQRLRSLLDENHSMGYRVMENLAGVISSRLRNIRMTLRIFHR